jgi:hypothetical protein
MHRFHIIVQETLEGWTPDYDSEDDITPFDVVYERLTCWINNTVPFTNELPF